MLWKFCPVCTSSKEECNDPGSLSCFNVDGLAERSVAERVTMFSHTYNNKQPEIALLSWHVRILLFCKSHRISSSFFYEWNSQANIHDHGTLDSSNKRSDADLTLRLLISYIYGAPSKARNANVVCIWTYVWQHWNSLFLFAAQCFNTESMQRGFLCHICV